MAIRPRKKEYHKRKLKRCPKCGSMVAPRLKRCKRCARALG